MKLEQKFVPQLDDLLAEYTQLAALLDQERGSSSAETASVRFLTRARAAIDRISLPGSAYERQCRDIIGENAVEGWKATRIAGVLQSLRADLEAGYLESVSGLVRGEFFADLLEMADHLLDEGYKDPAAVVAGSALEIHLRSLCEQAGIPVESDGRARKADQLNADLTKAGIYSKPDQKNVTSWLGLRNEAAHGHYSNYSPEQVRLLTASIRDFISRNPA